MWWNSVISDIRLYKSYGRYNNDYRWYDREYDTIIVVLWTWSFVLLFKNKPESNRSIYVELYKIFNFFSIKLIIFNIFYFSLSILTLIYYNKLIGTVICIDWFSIIIIVIFVLCSVTFTSKWICPFVLDRICCV